MIFEDWIRQITQSNNLCEEYADKVNNAISNKRIMDIVLDANGISYLCEMRERGYPLPYEIITSKFEKFINGKYIGEFKNAKSNGYTSTIYCDYSEDIHINTTLTCLLRCNSKIIIEPYSIAKIYCDSNTFVTIDCHITSKCILELYGNARYNNDKNLTNIEIIRK